MADHRRQPPNWRGAATRASGPAKAEPGPKRAGGKKRFLLLAAILGLAGVIAGLVTLLRSTPKPLFLGIAVTEYASYPPNPFGQQDSAALKDLFASDAVLAVQAQERRIFIEQLNALAERTGQPDDKGRPIVVHLTALAVVRDGEVHLLPGLAEPDNQASWLPLSEVLAALRRGQGSRLLLLDIAKSMTDARLGILSDDVADALDAQLKSAETAGDLSFLVLTSCGKSQTSHVSLELRHSVFGYFVQQGLLGHADGWDGQSPNEEIKAKELVKYVQAQVASWAANHSLPAQNPTLYGKGNDFVVISPQKPYPPLTLPERPEPLADKDKPAEKEKEKDKDKDKPAEPKSGYPKWLRAGWTERDNWVKDGSFRRTPRTFRHLEELLLRAERRWLAGDDETIVRDAFLDDAQKLRNLHKGFLPTGPDVNKCRSLAESRRWGIKDETDIAEKLSPLLSRLSDPFPPNPMELPMVLAEGLKPFLKMPPEVTPVDALALAGMNRLKEIANPTDAQLAAFDGFFKKAVVPPVPVPAEVLLVSYLTNLNPTPRSMWASDKALYKQLILQTGAAAEDASAIDPRAKPWVEKVLAEAYGLRRDGLYDLCVRESSERAKGKENLAEADRKFRQIIKDAQVLEDAYQRVDEAMILLPALVAPLGEQPPDKELWTPFSTVENLLPMLATPGAIPAELSSLSDLLNHQIGEVRKRFSAEELPVRLGRAASAVEARRLLEYPVWKAPDRAAIFDQAADQGQKMATAALKKANELKPGDPLRTSPAFRSQAPDWRAQLAIDLLRLDGVTNFKPLVNRLDQTKGSPSPAAWDKLGQEIRNAWPRALTVKFRESQTPTLAQQRIGFVLHPFDSSAIPLPRDEDRFVRDPAAFLRRDETSALWRWLADTHYLADAQKIGSYSRDEMRAYAVAMEEIGRALHGRKP